MSNVAVVILNWNGVDFMKKFIPGVVASCNRLSERLPGWTARTVVADNGSTDGSVEWMKGLGECADTLFFDRNYGFTGGYNKAFRELGGKGFDYFLLLNSDTRITQIAAQTGFSSFSQFNRVFHKFCGVSPSDYRLSTHHTPYSDEKSM